VTPLRVDYQTAPPEPFILGVTRPSADNTGERGRQTAPLIAEAERAIAVAYCVSVEPCGDCSARARAAVAAVVPILAEHFAQAVEAQIKPQDAFPLNPDGYIAFQAEANALDRAALAVREAATPTERAVCPHEVASLTGSTATCAACGWEWTEGGAT
jgi:hypothetical protein